MRTLRADLHVHSCHSLRSGNLRFLKSRDCYSRPEDVYRVAKARGMDLVTITDHDSIGGCLEYLDRHPDSKDFFISEEVSCRLPQGDVEVHLGVYGIDERLHRELQTLRRDVFEVTARLRESGVFFVLNHLLHFYRRQLPLDAYLRLLDEVPGVEARNGAMIPEHNALVEQIARRRAGTDRCAMVGGSDAHTLRRVGRTWTEAPVDAIEDISGFLTSLRECRSRPGGRHGGTTSVAGDAYGVVARYCASLLGAGPRDHRALGRTACLAFSLVSLPAQFLPLAIVASGKRREAREVRRVRHELSSWLARPAEAIQPVETEA
jgi:predicted metal-dependent phosphoesterase TrpH